MPLSICYVYVKLEGFGIWDRLWFLPPLKIVHWRCPVNSTSSTSHSSNFSKNKNTKPNHAEKKDMTQLFSILIEIESFRSTFRCQNMKVGAIFRVRVWASMRSKIRSGGACLVLRCSMCMSGSSQFKVQAWYCTDLFVGLVLHRSICRSGIALIKVQVWYCIDLGAGLVLQRSRCRFGIAPI